MKTDIRALNCFGSVTLTISYSDEKLHSASKLKNISAILIPLRMNICVELDMIRLQFYAPGKIVRMSIIRFFFLH